MQNSPFFIATKDGFFYEPAGVSVGSILWKDIAAIRENRLLGSQNSSFAPITIPVLILSLKEPKKYNRKYNFILKKIAELNSKSIKYQTQEVGDIIIEPIYFKERYAEIKELMEKHIALNK